MLRGARSGTILQHVMACFALGDRYRQNSKFSLQRDYVIGHFESVARAPLQTASSLLGITLIMSKDNDAHSVRR